MADLNIQLILRLVDRADLPADFVEDIERYKSRSGTVKINVALDRLPEFTSKPGFDPAVHGHWSRQVGDQPLVTLFVRA